MCIWEMFKDGFGSDIWGLKLLTNIIVISHFLIKLFLFSCLFISFIVYINMHQKNYKELPSNSNDQAKFIYQNFQIISSNIQYLNY